ncbi:probable tubulin polyglutamylase ttll-15 [Contarinia nasturtii]|uniref:probable tubulin polyglutamylase ttll-15 n=1 Tax=Contarinia nasturtii TaxID=265458 RepID=UPI0012D37856|nr:probable tubulin polyglutamylase ttll-15 [Contarinia nasturtii]XP_031617912.1 probable tubulin polyglutamylase ttll-15 [Contarinia nasturtii]XP_031617913.1 probable tubulin polyglutamylase ttll-15 [Contarinia nasturtii]XP_031617914.1 probable tubulin polyglutamylase ttll-15 [Contarinia nasturtii]XP_031617915.1 probable tubulin polyglutamylase ttll-15 [Contarinia nasturtii]
MSSSEISSKPDGKADDALNSQEAVNKIAKTLEKSHYSFLDLRTAQGQILFLLISIALSVLIQSLPNGTFTSVFNQEIPTHGHVTETVRHECNKTPTTASAPIKRPTYWIFGKSENEAHLKHVKNVLQRLGYEKVTNETTDWDLLWAHDYPFRVLYPKLHHLKVHQKVNHFPGCGFITNKVDLATTDLEFIPKAFRLPEDREKFIAYAEKYPEKMFVQKHNQHRHINIKPVKEINYNDNDTFVQEYVDNPLLVDGHKFDIGVYVIITSVDPLRVYIYKGDILFRYCPQKYHPFDPKNVDKYIVGDDYLPVWDIPSLAPFYNGFGFGMKHSFDAYIRSKNRDPNGIWIQVEEAIRQTLLNKEKHIINALKNYRHKRNFFEMMRFDLIVDDNLRVYLMEANMSPNLSSAHFQQNTLLYEQVIYNLMNLVGIGSSIHRESLRTQTTDAEQMMSADKNIAVHAEHCTSDMCVESCELPECELCRPCLSAQDISDLHMAYREHVNRGETKRIFPVPIISGKSADLSELNANNQKMSRWFAGKCAMESIWCS